MKLVFVTCLVEYIRVLWVFGIWHCGMLW